MTILPPPRLPSTRYRMASVTSVNGKVLSMTAVIFSCVDVVAQDLEVLLL
jgi:hypothetical protein